MIVPLPIPHQLAELSRRALYSLPTSADSEYKGPNTDPTSASVLIPLIISMVLIVLALGTAVFFYMGYKRRYGAWLANFQARRERERLAALEEEKKGGGSRNPGMWEVEVKEVDEEHEAWAEEYTVDRVADGDWKVRLSRPVWGS